MTPSRALCVSGESVLTTMPGCTGQAHDATGLGARSTSTRHIRPIHVSYCVDRRTSSGVQFPAIMSFLTVDLVTPRWLYDGESRLTHGSSICCTYEYVAVLTRSRWSLPRYCNTGLLACLNQCGSRWAELALLCIDFQDDLPSIDTFLPSERLIS